MQYIPRNTVFFVKKKIIFEIKIKNWVWLYLPMPDIMDIEAVLRPFKCVSRILIVNSLHRYEVLPLQTGEVLDIISPYWKR